MKMRQEIKSRKVALSAAMSRQGKKVGVRISSSGRGGMRFSRSEVTPRGKAGVRPVAATKKNKTSAKMAEVFIILRNFARLWKTYTLYWNI